MDVDTARWIIGGLLGLVGLLIAVIYSGIVVEIKTSRHFRHHVFPPVIAEIQTHLLKHDSALEIQDKRLNRLEDR